MITIVGGVYQEDCMHPHWHEIYGSAGRAASALAAFGCPAQLCSYANEETREVLEVRAALESFSLDLVDAPRTPRFSYTHGLASPKIQHLEPRRPSIQIQADKVVLFGFIEGEAIVHANYVVYDPQNTIDPQPFRKNGSSARHLAVVLNRSEACTLGGLCDGTPSELAEAIFSTSGAEVVVLKLGAFGAMVFDGQSEVLIPAYQTEAVWKIGSGDTFVAHFAYHWMEKGLPPAEAASLASKGTAYYCNTQGFPTLKQLTRFAPLPVNLSGRFRAGYVPNVYLASPFFTLAQLWLVEEIRSTLLSM